MNPPCPYGNCHHNHPGLQGHGSAWREGQITAWQWFRLPKAERERRVTEFRAADRALQAYEPPAGVPYSDDDPGYVEFNGRVNDLWPTVPWWCRS